MRMLSFPSSPCSSAGPEQWTGWPRAAERVSGIRWGRTQLSLVPCSNIYWWAFSGTENEGGSKDPVSLSVPALRNAAGDRLAGAILEFLLLFCRTESKEAKRRKEAGMRQGPAGHCFLLPSPLLAPFPPVPPVPTVEVLPLRAFACLLTAVPSPYQALRSRHPCQFIKRKPTSGSNFQCSLPNFWHY